MQSPVPLERWDLEAWYAPDIPPRRMVSYTRFAAFCTDIDRFEVRVILTGSLHWQQRLCITALLAHKQGIPVLLEPARTLCKHLYVDERATLAFTGSCT